jgi:4-amino-4-deoxy-L-arabinose transferase-like glycosyltransferase
MRSPWIGRCRKLAVESRTHLVLGVLLCWYALATLPGLGEVPPPGRDEAQITAAAWKLASQGVYGQDMYTGYYRSEAHVVEFMPVYPLLLSLGLRTFGPGPASARLVSVLCGLAALLLTYRLGLRLRDRATGLAAVGVACVLRLSQAPSSSGIPFVDLVRQVRFDALVPVLMLAALLAFLAAWERPAPTGFFGSGLLLGLATLTQPYAAALLPALAVTAAWRSRGTALRWLGLVGLGWLVALAPWVAYCLTDLEALRGQQLVNAAGGRFDLARPSFYWDNLLAERFRYAPWFGHALTGFAEPRLGPWLVLAGLPAGLLLLASRARHLQALAERGVLCATLAVGGVMALLMTEKRPEYALAVLPLGALAVAVALTGAWRAAGGRARWVLALLLAAAGIESAIGVAGQLGRSRRAGAYAGFTSALARVVPSGALVMAPHQYWFGFTRHRFRSLDLPFLLSNPLHSDRPLSMQAAMDRVAVEYVVVDRLVERFVFHPQPGDTAILMAQKQAFAATLQQRCAEAVGRVPSAAFPDYGGATLYRCRWSGTQTNPDPP